MGLFQVAETVRMRALTTLDGQKWLAPVIGRLAVGLVFMSTGWGKVHSLDKVTHFFMDLGIPMPGLNAVVVGYSELICGTLLVVGLASRFATVPLLVSMVVAILTAKRAELHGVFDLVGFDEFTYFAVLSMIALLGPGPASLDRLVARGFGWTSDLRAAKAAPRIATA